MTNETSQIILKEVNIVNLQKQTSAQSESSKETVGRKFTPFYQYKDIIGLIKYSVKHIVQCDEEVYGLSYTDFINMDQ